MFIPLVDILRCVRRPPHDDTWLVASIDRAEERDIIEGFLGCPICSAEYPIHEGMVNFDPDVVRPPFRAASEDEAIRLAAALDLVDPRMTAVLFGSWGSSAPLVRGLSPAQLLLVNPPAGITTGDAVSIVLSNLAPLATASVSGVAIDDNASPAMVASLAASLRSGGRMIGPISVAIPGDLMEIARDDEVWVARLETAATTSAPILPKRRSR
jgi:uncharacterized protein YbaR (Trm112 family)